MNSRLSSSLAALIFAIQAGGAQAGYKELTRQLDEYAPPRLFNSLVSRSETEPPAIQKTDLDDEIDRLRQEKAKWEQSLKSPSGESSFYTVKALSENALSEAEAALSDEFSLQQLELIALLRNAAVKAAEQKVQAALERYGQAWNLDEVLREYSSFTSGLMTKIGPMKGQEPVQMKFPFPGVLALKGEIVNQEAKAAREDLEIARRTAVTAARKAYWNLMFVHRAREISSETLSLLEHLEAVAVKRYEAGKTSFQDVVKVRIKEETVRENLNSLDEKQKTLEAKIRQTTGVEKAREIGRPKPPATEMHIPELDPLFSVALQRRQELRKMKAMIEKMERMIEMAETMIYPSYDMDLSLFQNRTAQQVGSFRMKEPFETTATADMGAGLPKRPWYGTSDAYLRETRKKVEAMRLDLKKMEDMTVFQVRRAWDEADRAAREEALYRDTIIDLSQAALEVSTTGYETGKVMFADVIVSYRDWLEAKLALERKRSDLGIALAELEETVGTVLNEMSGE